MISPRVIETVSSTLLNRNGNFTTELFLPHKGLKENPLQTPLLYRYLHRIHEQNFNVNFHSIPKMNLTPTPPHLIVLWRTEDVTNSD